MGQKPSRLTLRPDGRLVEKLDEARSRIAQETGESITRAAFMRQLLRQGLGDTAQQAALAEAHFRLAGALKRALIKLGGEMQERLVEIVEDELKAEAEG